MDAEDKRPDAVQTDKLESKKTAEAVTEAASPAGPENQAPVSAPQTPREAIQDQNSTRQPVAASVVPAPAEPPVETAGLHIEPKPADDWDFELLQDAEAERRIRRMSRKSFLWGAAAVAGTVAGINWLGTRRADGGVQWPFRRILEVNEGLSRDLFSRARLAPEFPKSAAMMPRPNGDYGVADEIDPDWQLRLVGLADMSAAQTPSDATDDSGGSDSSADSDSPDSQSAKSDPPADRKGAPKPPDKKAPASQDDNTDSESSDQSDSTGSTPSDVEPAVMVTMDQIRALPRAEIVTELKCIEGWSTVVHWAGVRLVDLMRKFPPATKDDKPFDPAHLGNLPEYVSMETPDGSYYVGLDMASALHPQTLLCYEMNGKPLTAEHGAPLRLAIPVKYGIKNIKNIGKIKFTDERPKDYWAEQGYDWYAGH